MDGLLLALPLNCKRDILLARQMARRAADLLGFNGSDQLTLAAAVFDLACQAQESWRRASVFFNLIDDRLDIRFMPAIHARRRKGVQEPTPLKMGKALPATFSVPRDDVAWMLRQLADSTPLDLFEEMRNMNQELLQMQLEVKRQEGNSAKQQRANVA